MRRRYFRWLSRRTESLGAYQVYGVTSANAESAKQKLVQRVLERYPEWHDNIDIEFDEFEECNVHYAVHRLQTDWKNQAVGNPENDGIWAEGGSILYSDDNETRD